MSNEKNVPIEIERKFLIYMPSIDALCSQKGIRIKKITQTYLASATEKHERLRKIEENDVITYIKTIKERITPLSCYEDEFPIRKEQYDAEIFNADPQKATVRKTRYAFEFDGHVMEIDIYPFWSDRAILEVELGSEDEHFSVPDLLKIIKEVSLDKRYKNTNLAKSIPYDEI